ncbi:SHOCT-like domain-containing protein [Methanobacterium petrolearium]|uniref:SHOCT-like domain-containing protein n=1 Tax=Methanobacterium petrolearium TaxID=710190 RepID=UPI001AE62D37|nr:hypothetical protein [Methanobacterium petrolearium]MBP1945564.1 hypothetical protein [Methanobacterium petrolearium]BDZ71782.1 hypothetical protein GCM10025861_22990 [Methanobacterium petrolearium]
MSNDIKEERMQILEMVEDGKINPSEAEELLDALGGDQEEINPKTDAKWLKIRVRTMDDNPKVNVNIPISLVDVGLKLAKKFDPKMEEAGLDQIDLDEIVEAVKSGAKGKIVDVEDEENQTRVNIYVE